MHTETRRGRYRTYGRRQTPLSFEAFDTAMKASSIPREHRGFIALAYYSGCRITEVLRSKWEQFFFPGTGVIEWDVGVRLKHGIETPNLIFDLSLPYMDDVAWSILGTKPSERVWKFTARTGYNIISTTLHTYPHHLRLSRITNIALKGGGLVELHSWTGLTPAAISHYTGIIDNRGTSKKLS